MKEKDKEKETIFFGHECNQQMHTQVFLNIVHQQQQDKLRNKKKWLERSKLLILKVPRFVITRI